MNRVKFIEREVNLNNRFEEELAMFMEALRLAEREGLAYIISTPLSEDLLEYLHERDIHFQNAEYGALITFLEEVNMNNEIDTIATICKQVMDNWNSLNSIPA